MKKILLLPCILIFLIACGEGEGETVERNKLQVRNHIAYLPNQETPFTGMVRNFYTTGQIAFEVRYKEGSPDGLETTWRKNGEISQERNFKDGKGHGTNTSWYDNGQKMNERSYKEGKAVGTDTTWHRNGQKYRERNYNKRTFIQWNKYGTVKTDEKF